MKLNCIITDDEPLARKQIESYVARIHFLNLIGTARTPAIMQAMLQNHAVDLIFLDIKMPKMTGVEFLQAGGVLQQVIIITAYPEFAVTGFELEVTDYLMKPVTFERFAKACEKALHRLSGSTTIRLNSEQPDALYIKCNQRFEKIPLQDILFAEAMLNYVHIVTASRKYTVYSSLKALEASLPAEQFVRVHKSYIVSIQRISSVNASQLTIGDYVLPVSRAHRAATLQKFFLKDQEPSARQK